MIPTVAVLAMLLAILNRCAVARLYGSMGPTFISAASVLSVDSCIIWTYSSHTWRI